MTALRRKGVGHSDYVDRYFSFGVPDDDIADAKVGELLTQLSAGEGDTDLAYRLMTDTDRIVRKLDLRRSRDEVTTRALIELVGRHFGGLSDMNASDRLSSRTVAQRFAQRLVTELPNGVGDVLDRLDGSLASAVFATRLLHASSDRGDPALRAEQSARIQAHLEPYLAAPFPDVPQDVRELVTVWSLVDPSRCRAWLRAQIDADRWDGLDLAGWKLDVVLDDGEAQLRSFNDETVEELVGIAYLTDKYADQLDALPELRRTLADTREDRRLGALYALRAMRSRQAERTEDGETSVSL